MHDRLHVESGGPRSVRFDADFEDNSVFVHMSRLGGRNDCLAPEVGSFIQEVQVTVLDPSGGVPGFLYYRIPAFEEVGEVVSDFHSDIEVDWFLVVVEDRQPFVEAAAD